MDFIWKIIIGLLAGALAKLFMPGKDPGGRVRDQGDSDKIGQRLVEHPHGPLAQEDRSPPQNPPLYRHDPGRRLFARSQALRPFRVPKKGSRAVAPHATLSISISCGKEARKLGVSARTRAHTQFSVIFPV